MMHSQYKVVRWLEDIQHQLSQKLSRSHTELILDHLLSVRDGGQISILIRDCTCPTFIESLIKSYHFKPLLVEGTITTTKISEYEFGIDFNILEPLIYFGMKRDYSGAVVIYRPDLDRLSRQLQIFEKHGRHFSKNSGN